MTASEPQNTSVYLTHLPNELENQDLLDLFQHYGQITHVYIGKGKFSSYAYVNFATYEAAENAIKKPPSEIKGYKNFYISWAQKKLNVHPKNSQTRPVQREQAVSKPEERAIQHKQREISAQRRSKKEKKDKKKQREIKEKEGPKPLITFHNWNFWLSSSSSSSSSSDSGSESSSESSHERRKGKQCLRNQSKNYRESKKDARSRSRDKKIEKKDKKKQEQMPQQKRKPKTFKTTKQAEPMQY